MTLDSNIRSVLDHRAGTVETPWPPPLEDLLDAGRTEVRRRRTRHRRVGVGVLAAALLLGLPAGLVLAGGSTDDGEGLRVHDPVARTDRMLLRQLPVGAAPSSLYCLDGVAHWGEWVVAMSDGVCGWPHRYAEAGGSAVVVDSGRQVVTLFTSSGRQDVPARVDTVASPVVLSPDGHTVAWVSRVRVDGREEVVLWDAVRRAEVARVQAPTPDELNLEGIDEDGRVYMTSAAPGEGLAGRIWVWNSRHHQGFVRVIGTGDFVTVADVPRHGLVVLRTMDEAGGGGHAVGGRVTDEGRFVPEWDADVRLVVWSPDRSRYVRVESPTVVSPPSQGDGGGRVRLRLPTDVSVAGVPSWESAEQVLVPVAPTTGDGVVVLRCSAANGRCEVAAVGASNVVLPGDDADNLR